MPERGTDIMEVNRASADLQKVVAIQHWGQGENATLQGLTPQPRNKRDYFL